MGNRKKAGRNRLGQTVSIKGGYHLTLSDFSGKIVLDYPELSGSVLKRKLGNIEATGVDTVVANCILCVLKLRGGLDKHQTKVEVVHCAKLIAKCWQLHNDGV